MKYYNIRPALNLGCLYTMVVGERSNGKTYSALDYALEQFFTTGEQFAYFRRWELDTKKRSMSQLFSGHIENKVITKYSKGVWDSIVYYCGAFYPARYNEELDKVIRSETPCGFGFAISMMEHNKSTSYPNVKTIIFDEFTTRSIYLTDEFVLWLNCVSTIVRDRDNVRIIMLGNTVDFNSPYFREMGLTKIRNQKAGTIDIYKYGDSGKTTVAVERTETPKTGKKSDIYFAFDNPKLKMITNGAWEMEIYPHCPYKYKPNDIVFTYFIKYQTDLLQCDIVVKNRTIFTFIHRKTTDIKNPDKDLIYSENYDARNNHARRITRPLNSIQKKIYSLFVKEKVFYQDNEVGEIVRNYLQFCVQDKKVGI